VGKAPHGRVWAPCIPWVPYGIRCGPPSPPMTDVGRYPVPAGPHRVEDVERRSRFVTTVARAPDPAAAHDFVDRIRVELPDATHHCWAFVAGPPGSTARVGMSDDGEPHGTAGRPMLTALLHGGVGEIVAVCTRYYGGTQLGTGGLARAYAGGVTRALERLPTVERVVRVRAHLAMDYAHVDPVRRLLASLDVVVADERYGADVRYEVLVPEADAGELETRLADATAGEARLEIRRDEARKEDAPEDDAAAEEAPVEDAPGAPHDDQEA